MAAITMNANSERRGSGLMAQAADFALPGPVQQIVALVAGSDIGLTAAELTEAAQSRFPGQHPRRIAGLIDQALKVGALVQVGERLRVPTFGAGGALR